MPGASVLVPIPVAHMDRPPEGEETSFFTYHPASVYDEHWVLIDVPEAHKQLRRVLDALTKLPGLMTPLGSP